MQPRTYLYARIKPHIWRHKGNTQQLFSSDTQLVLNPLQLAVLLKKPVLQWMGHDNSEIAFAPPSCESNAHCTPWPAQYKKALKGCLEYQRLSPACASAAWWAPKSL